MKFKLDIDNALKDVYVADVLAAKKAQNQDLYEAKIVKKILASAKMPERDKELLHIAKERTGKGKLTLAGFLDHFPSFPMWLVAKRLPHVYKLSVKDIFNKFTSTPIYKAWMSAFDEAPYDIRKLPGDQKPIGLVFDWQGIRGTQMIVHNLPISQAIKVSIQWTADHCDTTFSIAPFDAVLQELLRGWAES